MNMTDIIYIGIHLLDLNKNNYTTSIFSEYRQSAWCNKILYFISLSSPFSMQRYTICLSRKRKIHTHLLGKM